MSHQDKLAQAEHLAQELQAHSAHLAAAEYRWLRQLAAFDQIRGWELLGIGSCAQWLSYACGLGPVTARERLRVAHALDQLPHVRQHFKQGQLSYSKVRAITRIATPQTEETLCHWALHSTAAQLERIVRKYRWTKRLQDTQKAHETFQNRYLKYWYDEDGSLNIRARLPADDGALVMKAIRTLAEHAGEDPNPEREDHHGLPPDTYGFHQKGRLPELIAYNNDSSNLWPARYADALRTLAETTLATGPKAHSGPDRHEMIVHVDLASLRGDPEAETGYIQDATALPIPTLQRLACDTGLRIQIEDQEGNPLYMGHRTRTIPRALRKALQTRDQGCRFPACTAHRYTDAHHIKHFAHGGPTTIDNLITLCRFHHRLLHEYGYQLRINAPNDYTFLRPDLTPIPRHPQPPTGDPGHASAENRRQGIPINHHTPMPRTYTHRPDYGIAIEGLWKRDTQSQDAPHIQRVSVDSEDVSAEVAAV